jgi:glycerol kinase
MSLYIGLDVGTTNLGAVALDVETGALRARATIANTAYLPTAPGRVEIGLPELERLLVRTLSEIAGQVPAGQVHGVGMTGQMHGVALLDRQASPGVAINWQTSGRWRFLPGPSKATGQFIAQAGGPPRSSAWAACRRPAIWAPASTGSNNTTPCRLPWARWPA